MRIEQKRSIVFRGEATLGDTTELRILHTNRGEPFREGIELSLDTNYANHATIFLDNTEACELRDLLNRLYPVEPSK